MQKDLQGSLLPLSQSGLISINDASILSLQLERKNQLMMKSYLLQFAEILFRHPLTPSWPLPVWLGGRYANIVKPGYAARVPTKAKYWTFSHLHLAACTSRYLFVPYSGSKNRPDVWMFFTKVNNPTHLLTWALTCECMKESPYHRLSMGPRVKRTG
jgi:hypothetical protein